jgi:hypothetical protein
VRELRGFALLALPMGAAGPASAQGVRSLIGRAADAPRYALRRSLLRCQNNLIVVSNYSIPASFMPPCVVRFGATSAF